MNDSIDDRIDQIVQETRQIRLLQFRLLQLQQLYDQLGAGIQELTLRTSRKDPAEDGVNPTQWEPTEPVSPARPDTMIAVMEKQDGVLAGRRILLADDSADSRIIATRLLVRLGCVVDVVENGLEALIAAAQSPYDLILMDCWMPELDGFAATAAIRAFEAIQADGRHLVIVATTSSTSEADRQHCFQVGMDDFLPKPYRITELTQTLSCWLLPVDA